MLILNKMRNKIIYLIIFSFLIGVFNFQTASAQTVPCTSVATCTQRQQDLRRQQQEARQKFEQSRRESNTLQETIANLQAEISYTQSRIRIAEEQITTTQKIIDKLSTDISSSESELRNAYVMLYELSRNSSIGIFFQSSINDALTQAQFIQSIQTQLKAELAGLKNSMTERESQKKDLENQKSELEQDRTNLATKKSQQTHLLTVSQRNVSYYQGLDSDIQRQIAEVERRLSVLIAQASWGGDIVSANNPSWFFNQLDFPNTFMGSSPYTVAQYGCLIVSYAMVSTFHGRRVSPVDIASRTENFNRQAFLIRQPPTPLQFQSVSSSRINWAVLNAELAANRPVIVSLFIPSVGAINSDGSSHFVVIHGRSANRYLMHDPLGPGRSYAANLLRSMIIIRP